MTIRMKDAGSIKLGDVTREIGKALGVGTWANMRNRELTVQLSYTGSLDEVTKLIDFGVVTSKDEKSRTITVEPK